MAIHPKPNPSVPSVRDYMCLGHQVQTPETAKLDPHQLYLSRQLAQTIVDCHMIAQGRWQYFKGMRWHNDTDAERIYISACRTVLDWINSDRFAFYMKLAGRDIGLAREHLCEVLNGKHVEEVELLLNYPNPTGITGDKSCRRRNDVY